LTAAMILLGLATHWKVWSERCGHRPWLPDSPGRRSAAIS
jgi:hypothetical protein